LTVETVDDLKKLLKDMGYSLNAVNEILKWYKENNSNRRA
jgi:hypothetical protein